MQRNSSARHSACDPLPAPPIPQTASLRLLRGREVHQILSSINLRSKFDKEEEEEEEEDHSDSSELLSSNNPFSKNYRQKKVSAPKKSSARSHADQRALPSPDKTKNHLVNTQSKSDKQLSSIRQEKSATKNAPSISGKSDSNFGNPFTTGPSYPQLMSVATASSVRTTGNLAKFSDRQFLPKNPVIDEQPELISTHSRNSSSIKSAVQKIPAPQAESERIRRDFARIRRDWARIVKQVESASWIIGHQNEHEKRLEKFCHHSQADSSYCDVVISTADHQALHAHSLVLASHSKAFAKRLMATSGDPGSATNFRVNLTDKIDSYSVAKIVDWIYHGHIRVSLDNLPKIAEAAKHFGTIPLLVECVRQRALHGDPTPKTTPPQSPSWLMPPSRFPNVARQSVSTDSPFLTTRSIERSPQKPELGSEKTPPKPEWTSRLQTRESSESLFADLAKPTPKDVQTSPILNLSAEEIIRMLSDDELQVQSELWVLDTVMSWIAVAPEHRQIYLSELLDCVRFSRLSDGELKRCFHVHPEYFKFPLFRTLLGQAFRERNSASNIVASE